MPKHYEELELDDSQEAKVRSIQTHYRSESQKLRERLTSLASSRDEQLAAVLKPAQRKKLEELVAAAHEAKVRKKAVAGDTAPAKRQAKTSAS